MLKDIKLGHDILPGLLINHLYQLCITQGMPAEVTKGSGSGCDCLHSLGIGQLPIVPVGAHLTSRQNIVWVA